jgi:hypothetical protein
MIHRFQLMQRLAPMRNTPSRDFFPMKLVLVVLALCVSFSTYADDFFAQRVLQDVTFQIESPNNSSINLVTVRAESATDLIGAIEIEADGTITDVEIADLNVDGFPEIYVYVNSAGSGSYGSLIAYASNRNQSLSEIYLPTIEEGSAEADGYMGHDEFRVVENNFVQRFPVYRLGDPNAAPSGGIRQIQYKLEAGEAGWVLRKVRVTNY